MAKTNPGGTLNLDLRTNAAEVVAKKVVEAGQQVQTPIMAIPVAKAGELRARALNNAFEWMCGLIYGDFGVGKTWLAASAVLVPEMRDVLYISLEGGEKGIKELHKLCREREIDMDKHLMVIPVQSYKQYAQIYEFLCLHISFRDAGDDVSLRRLEAQIFGVPNSGTLTPEQLEQIIPVPKKFRTVISDSLTEAQKYCMYQLLGIDPMTHKLDDEPDAAQFQDWGRSREMIQFLVRRYRDLPIHSLFTCGQDYVTDSKNQFHYDPLLPGKLSNDVRGLVDFVGYYASETLEGGRIRRALVLQGGEYGGTFFAAKNRFGSVFEGSMLTDPTMVEIYKLDQGIPLGE